MKIEVTQCSMCTHYNKEQYCEVWEQYITNDAFYCACGVRAYRKTENCSEIPNNCKVECEKCKRFREEADTYMKQCEYYFMECRFEPKDEPQTDNGTGCSRCEGRFDCYDRDMPHAVRCNNYGKITDEPQTDCAWK